MTIKAIAVKESWLDSDVLELNFIIPETGDVLQEDLPEGGIEAVPKGLWIAGVQESYIYTGKETVTFAILGKDIADEDVLAANLIVKYNKKTQKSAPTVMRDGKKLKNKTDYTLEYPDLLNEDGSKNPDAYKVPGTYTIVVKGKGGYIGERKVTLTITECTFMNKMSVSKIANQAYTGSELKPDVTVKNGKTVLVKDTDYTVRYENKVEIGTATAAITGIGNYTGEKRVTFKITGISISKAKMTELPKNVTYTGQPITIEDFKTEPVVTVTVNKKPVTLERDVDYTVNYTNNVKKGKLTISFTGIGKYTGTIKKTVPINAYNMATDAAETMSVIMDEAYVYQKGGVKPEPMVLFGNIVLVKGQDYTVSYKNNTAVNDGTNAKKCPTVTIKGKGNFAGTISVTFKIEKQEFSVLDITVADKTYGKKKNVYKSVPKIYDVNGKELKAGTDYEKAYVYAYKNETVLADRTAAAGEVVAASDIVPAGTVLIVTVTGKGNYAASKLQGEYRVTAASVSSAKVTVPAQIYTGAEITPKKEELTVKVGKTVLTGDDYDIISYSNNVKKGSASLTIKGKGNYGGTKTVKFTIKAKGVSWYWREMLTALFE